MTFPKRVVVLGLSAFTLGLCAQACTLWSDTNVTAKEEAVAEADGGGVAPTSTTPGDDVGATCGQDDFDTPDLSKLTACGNGKGHCFDKTKTSLGSQLVACDKAGEVCVPDEVLAAGGKKLVQCASIIGPGGCVNMDLIPEMKKRGGTALKEDVCPAGLTCAPGTNPEANNAPTGFTEAYGVHKNPCTGGTAPDAPPAPSCCMNKVTNKPAGACISADGVPEDMRSMTSADTCTGGLQCVPAGMLHAEAKPCTTILGKGACIDTCFNELMGFAATFGILNQNECGPEEVCIACSVLPDVTPGCGAQ